MVLELLQHPTVQTLRTKTPVLDLGTGSGILALGASILFNTTVDAIEIDPLALQNAHRNVVLNGAAGARVTLIEGDLEAARGPYPLILANIYAEVLCDLEPGFSRLISPGGLLIVSGIMTSLEALVTEAYGAWGLLEIRRNGGWIALLFSAPQR
jgi:ribosomal protein L11 methyltransferase